MNAFTYIISFFLTENKNFDFDEMKNKIIKTHYNFYGFICATQTQQHYIELFVKSNLNALFIQPNVQKKIEEAFTKSQKVYHGMSRLARHFKVKHARKFDAEHDLCLNSLSELQPSLILDLYDEKQNMIYRFRISDLITIINTALSHSPDFFADPQKIRNPYTNVEFTRAQLYSIYFCVSKSSYVMPVLFHHFFMCEFDLERFCKENECYIREEAIKSFVRNGTNKQKHIQIMKMMVDYRKELKGIIIHDDFPIRTLVKHFSVYLKDYLLECYSLNPAIRYYSKRKLKRDLQMFRKLNPSYGRKIIRKKLIAFDLDNSNNSPKADKLFVFGREHDEQQHFKNEISFIDNVITNMPIPRSRRTSRNRIAQRSNTRTNLLRNRRQINQANEEFNRMINEAFALLRNTTELPQAQQGQQAQEGQQEQQADVEVTSDNEDDISNYSDETDSIDIDNLIYMMDSDNSDIDSDDEFF